MKSWFAKFRHSDEILEAALRNSKPGPEIPTTLHNSIMRAVQAAHRDEDAQVASLSILRRLADSRWLSAAGLTCVFLLGVWLMFSHRVDRTTANAQTLPEISTAFTTSQQVMDALPSATVGPLSNELDNVGRDLDRTAEFLLATLP